MQVFERTLWSWNQPINNENSKIMTERKIQEIVFCKNYNYTINENIFPVCIHKISVYTHSYRTLNSIPPTIEYLELLHDPNSNYNTHYNFPSTIKQIRINGLDLSREEELYILEKIKIPFGCEVFNSKDEKLL